METYFLVPERDIKKLEKNTTPDFDNTVSALLKKNFPNEDKKAEALRDALGDFQRRNDAPDVKIVPTQIDQLPPSLPQIKAAEEILPVKPSKIVRKPRKHQPDPVVPDHITPDNSPVQSPKKSAKKRSSRNPTSKLSPYNTRKRSQTIQVGKGRLRLW
jgi:hypothetical protein